MMQGQVVGDIPQFVKRICVVWIVCATSIGIPLTAQDGGNIPLLDSAPSSNVTGVSTPIKGSSETMMDASRLGPGQSAVAGSTTRGTSGAPPYKLLRYDEDYSYLKDPARRTDFWDPIKYLPIDESKNRYLTFGGDVREWFESYHNDSFGNGPGNFAGNNTYFLQRYMLYGDLHVSSNFRAFVQTINGDEDGRIGGPRPLIDRDEFDLHQAFLDWKWELGSADTVTWRLGRQEFEYGTGRLIDVREGPNLRLSFDAARALTKVGDWSIDYWWAKPVLTRLGTFDDEPDPNVSFWGTYGVRPIGDGSKANVDLYYLGFQNQQAQFDGQQGAELRHSWGTRLWARPKPWEYNLEYVYQSGSFNGGPINAWTAAHAARYTFEELKFQPRPGLRFDVASGTRNAAAAGTQTFNPMFPSGAYFNLTGPFGPSNIIDLHPTLDLQLTEKVMFSTDWNFFWRESLDDGVYRLSGSSLASGTNRQARYIGSSPAVTLVWNVQRHVTVLMSYVHVFPGPFIEQSTAGKPIDYFTTWLTYKF